MKLFRNYMKRCIQISRDNKMCVRVIGDPDVYKRQKQRNAAEIKHDFGVYH